MIYNLALVASYIFVAMLIYGVIEDALNTRN
jgi:hypothetical protein